MDEREEEERMLALLEAEPVAPGHLSRAALHRVLGGEADAAARAHAEGCPHCRARLDALDAERRAFLAARPPAAFAAALEARRRAARPWWQRAWLPGAGLALAAAAAAVLLLARPTVEPPPPTTRVKAAVGLSFHVRAGDTVRNGQPGAVLHPGDAIQLRYSTPAHRHLVVVSLDGRGAVTPFYDDAGRSLSIEPGAARLLEGSVVLDDALGTERVVGCFSPTPLDTEAVVTAARDALEAAGGDPRKVERLPLDCAQATFTFEKKAR